MEGEGRRGREETREPESSNSGRSIANPSSLPRRSARRRRSRNVHNDRRSEAESSSRGRSISNPSSSSRRNVRRRPSRSRSVDNDRSSRSGTVDNDRRSTSGTLDNDRRRSNRSSTRVDGTIITSNEPNDDNGVSIRRRQTARMSVTHWEYINPSSNPATDTQQNYITSDNAGTQARRTLRPRRQEFIFNTLEEAQILEQAHLLMLIADVEPIRPADRAAVQQLPRVLISEEHINNNNDNSTCPICQEKYQVGEEARVMECGHMYHKACIFEWLENQPTCPLCRFEMPAS